MVLPFMALVGVVLIWWANIAVDARILVQTSIIDRVVEALLRGTAGSTAPTASVAATPSYSYGLTVLAEQCFSVIVWAVGLAFFAFFRKLQPRELFLGGLFLAAVSTIPIAIFARQDVLQRSYLFALFPFVILTAWLLERRSTLTLRRWNLFRPLRSEEHTSELQSLRHLVCRLLLEKKKHIQILKLLTFNKSYAHHPPLATPSRLK